MIVCIWGCIISGWLFVLTFAGKGFYPPFLDLFPPGYDSEKIEQRVYSLSETVHQLSVVQENQAIYDVFFGGETDQIFSLIDQ